MNVTEMNAKLKGLINPDTLDISIVKVRQFCKDFMAYTSSGCANESEKDWYVTEMVLLQGNVLEHLYDCVDIMREKIIHMYAEVANIQADEEYIKKAVEREIDEQLVKARMNLIKAGVDNRLTESEIAEMREKYRKDLEHSGKDFKHGGKVETVKKSGIGIIEEMCGEEKLKEHESRKLFQHLQEREDYALSDLSIKHIKDDFINCETFETFNYGDYNPYAESDYLRGLKAAWRCVDEKERDKARQALIMRCLSLHE